MDDFLDELRKQIYSDQTFYKEGELPIDERYIEKDYDNSDLYLTDKAEVLWLRGALSGNMLVIPEDLLFELVDEERRGEGKGLGNLLMIAGLYNFTVFGEDRILAVEKWMGKNPEDCPGHCIMSEDDDELDESV